MSRLLLLLSIIFILPNLHARLFIKKPDLLAEKFDRVKGIDYRSFVAPDKLNFNKTILGHLVRPENNDACEPLQSFAPIGTDTIENPIVIAVRGHCSLGHKVHNVQTAGASMLIVIMDVPELPMRGHHDQHIRHSNIEVVIIKKSDGDIIMDFLDKSLENPSHETAYIEVSFTLDEENAPITADNYKNNSVIVDFWLSSSDTSESTYRILEDFKPIWDHFEGVIFTPRYVTWECPTCKVNNFKQINPNCLSGGRYCDPEATGDTVQGNEVILEDLRQICIFKIDEELWWSYVVKFGQLCSQEREELYDTCGDEVFGELQVEDDIVLEINQCMATSFKVRIGENLKATLNDNSLLRENYDLQNRMGVIQYPSLFANWNRYTGNLFNTKDLLQFICGHFIVTPDTCNNAIPFIPTESESVEVILFLVFTITVIIMVAVVCYVRMRVKRSVYMEMRDEVGGIVAQYRQFKDRANTNTTLEMSQ